MNKSKKLSLVAVDEIPLAQDVPTHDLIALFCVCTQMEQLCEQEKGIGLSAAQVGIPWKLFVVRRDVGYEYYINCEYFSHGELRKFIEGCLSLKNSQDELRRFELERHSSIRLKGQQLKVTNVPSLILEDIDRIESDLYAAVFQHEIDYQNGILISNIGREIEISNFFST
jgi:peptide deformylase